MHERVHVRAPAWCVWECGNVQVRVLILSLFVVLFKYLNGKMGSYECQCMSARICFEHVRVTIRVYAGRGVYLLLTAVVRPLQNASTYMD